MNADLDTGAIQTVVVTLEITLQMFRSVFRTTSLLSKIRHPDERYSISSAHKGIRRLSKGGYPREVI